MEWAQEVHRHGAVALYLDVVNIFIRVLEIMGKKDD